MGEGQPSPTITHQRKEPDMPTATEYGRLSRAEISNHLRAVIIPDGTPVLVYRNLHDKVFSVCVQNAAGSWPVVHHTLQFAVVDAKFNVQPAGRERIRKGLSKTVHAFVQGIWSDDFPQTEWVYCRYQPKVTDWWTNTATGDLVFESAWVRGETDGEGAQRLFVPA
jgi:hypothetical protein